MKERCPACGMRFERAEGFFLGAWVMNYAVVGLVTFTVLMAVIAVKAADPNASVLPVVGVGTVAAAITPIVAYPWSRTVWVAIELIMRSLEPREVSDADQARATEQERGA